MGMGGGQQIIEVLDVHRDSGSWRFKQDQAARPMQT